MVEMAELNSGFPQFRITESGDSDAPVYFFFGQPEMENDLTGVETHSGSRKQIRTFDHVGTLQSGDLIFSLICGKAAMVRCGHDGYLYTQNYVKLFPAPAIDARYLVYMLNEDANIKCQLQSGQQGSVTVRFSIRHLSNLVFPIPPPMEKQRVIGEVYFNQLRLAALKKRSPQRKPHWVLRN
ncbi:restriction endonuclease subunit S [Parasphaerochaeta coccoides]|uniref:restriction endonuclease subunit S n=1 Tax=Parasphaerochaeta coccoides TaxID=273376 RepID=UPI001C07200F|nr:restriction endonuclease subunit S [Parasphaerochaeta coccoides]